MKRGPKPRPLAERLFEKAKELENGCLVWTGTKNAKGYGILRVSPRNHLTHRLAWELMQGPVPDDLCVLHRCDNPACINANHLFLGTRGDNNADMLAKGRHVPQRNGKPPRHAGETHPQTKLSAEQVKAIRASDLTTAEIADAFGTSRSTIRMIRRGATWKTVV